MSFTELGLSDDLVRAVSDHGYTEPTPIQRQAIPAVLAGGDLMGGAQTGTGKTAAFVLPILQRLRQANGAATESRRRASLRVLIVVPTRELAAQVEESVRTYGKYTGLKSIAIFGGVNINPQIQRLSQGVDLVIATPGRLLDHVHQRTIDLSRVETLVLDEADRMLDMGFIPDIRRILKLLPPKRQNLLFSATFSDEIRKLATGLLKNPVTIQVAERNAAAALVSHKVYPVDRDRKRELLSHLIRERQWFQVLVFTRTKHGANRLSEQLCKDGIPSLAIHGNKSQSARTRALAEFKSGTLQVLVATDIAARGLDIVELPHVVNFDLPHVPEDYVHRIGRTGRAGSEGEASSLVSHDERNQLADIERLIRQSIPKEVLPGFERGKSGPRSEQSRPIERPARRPQNSGAPASGNRGSHGERSGRPPMVRGAGTAPGRRDQRSGSAGGRTRSFAPKGRGRAR